MPFSPKDTQEKDTSLHVGQIYGWFVNGWHNKVNQKLSSDDIPTDTQEKDTSLHVGQIYGRFVNGWHNKGNQKLSGDDMYEVFYKVAHRVSFEKVVN